MSLYQCEECGCVENTALGGYWKNKIDKCSLKCSACNSGKWHGKFKRIFLPMGKFETNRVGNLSHKENGDDDFKKYEIKRQDIKQEQDQ